MLKIMRVTAATSLLLIGASSLALAQGSYAIPATPGTSGGFAAPVTGPGTTGANSDGVMGSPGIGGYDGVVAGLSSLTGAMGAATGGVGGTNGGYTGTTGGHAGAAGLAGGIGRG